MAQQPQEPPPSDVEISSIGIAESLIERVKGTQDRGVEVQSVSVGVEMLTRQCVCFVWTFREQVNLNMVYNESFHDEKDTALFLQTVKEILLKELDEGSQLEALPQSVLIYTYSRKLAIQQCNLTHLPNLNRVVSLPPCQMEKDLCFT